MTLRRVATCLILSFLTLPAAADGIHHNLHGGRATAQAGAMTARADEPSAVTYNPAAIVRLEGLQVQGGLDFESPTDDYESASGSHRANHTIQFPPSVYATWRPEPGDGGWLDRLAFGIGLDTPVWYRVDWNTALFPARFNTRLAELRLFELHPVVAYEIDEHWSVGGGLRYIFGSLEQGFNVRGVIVGGNRVDFELETTADSSVDALGFDLALHYDSPLWGFGAVYRSETDLEDNGDFEIELRDITNPALSNLALAAFPYDGARQNFSLPAELVGGVWLAPYPELKVELDVSFKNWSSLDDSKLFITSTGGVVNPVSLVDRRDWKNTVAIRLGAEGELNDTWSVGGGIAFEPSPVSDQNLEPGFPRGDAMVYSFGGSYHLEKISFDLGYSFHDRDDREQTGLEADNPARRGTFSGRDQVWAVNARWRF